MPGLSERSAITRLAGGLLDDHVVSLAWSPCGRYLAALPSEGRIVVLEPETGATELLSPHRGGNGSVAWHPRRPILASYGQDGVVRLTEPPFAATGRSFETGSRGWAERLAWNPDGSLIAVGAGRSLKVLDAGSGDTRQVFPNHKSTVCDLAWNPTRADELAAVCDGGLRLWRLGTTKEIGSFDWGGASLAVSWSPDGRWVATGDQTPSVHIYEVTTRVPLHIQGFPTRVKAFSWQGRGEWLAVAGGEIITVWPCTGKCGPDGATPIPLLGHVRDVTALRFAANARFLLSAGRDGMLFLWKPHDSADPALLLQSPHEISAIALHPQDRSIATGDAVGGINVWRLKASAAGRSCAPLNSEAEP